MLKKTVFVALLVLFSPFVLAEPVWIDVRTLEEHQADNIDGDARITHSEIVLAVSEIYPDKDTEIQLYCRSGGRAGKAMSKLLRAGYTNVRNAGGINDARQSRGLEAN